MKQKRVPGFRCFQDLAGSTGCGPDRPIGISAPAGESAGPFQQGEGDASQGAVFEPAGAVLHQQHPFIPSMLAIGEAIGRQGIAHQHQLISRKPLQKHGHRRVHMHPVGDQPQSNAALTTGRTQGARRTVMRLTP